MEYSSKEENGAGVDSEISMDKKPGDQQTATTTTQQDQIMEEVKHHHIRLGHVPYRKILEMAKNGNIDTASERLRKGKYTTEIRSKIMNMVCEACMRGRTTRVATTGEIEYQVETTLDMWVADTLGPFKYRTHDGKRYAMVVMDVYAHRVWVVLLKSKDEAWKELQRLTTQEQTQKGRTLKRQHTDGGGEYVNNEMKEYYAKQGTIQTWTTRDTPQHNALVERMNRTLAEKTRTIMWHAGAGARMWGEAIQAAAYLINNLPCTWTGQSTPNELYTGVSTSHKHLVTWGCNAYVHNKQMENKMDSTSHKCAMVGYDVNNGVYYYVFDPRKRKTVRVHDVRFDEENFSVIRGVQDDGVEEEDDDDTNDDLLQLDRLLQRRRELPAQGERPAIEQDKDESKNENDSPAPRRTTRVSIPPQRYDPSYGMCVVDYLSDLALTSQQEEQDPVSFQEAMECNKKNEWMKAMDEEWMSLIENGTWEVVDERDDMNIVGCKWIYKTKTNSDGKVERYKARLVAKGYTQREGIDFNETFAPVLKYKTLRLILALSTGTQTHIEQLDIKTAFLNATVKEDIYVEVPDGRKLSVGIGKVLKLNKALYGTKQAPHEWNENINAYLLEIGFRRCTKDTCLYIKTSKSGKRILIGLFVDDMVISYKKCDKEEWMKMKIMIKMRYKLSDMGEVHQILGMRVMRDENGDIYLDQEKYLKGKLKEFGMENCRPMITPEVIMKREGSNTLGDEDTNTFRKIVGSMIYAATSTRPDIAHAVHMLTRHMQQPLECDMVSAKRLLRYLRGALEWRIVYRHDENREPAIIEAYSDADLGGDMQDGKSTSGHCQFINKCLINWGAHKQGNVALSTSEAEWISASECTKEVMWLLDMMSEIGVALVKPITIYEDNQSTIKICENDVLHGRNKHVKLRYHQIREEIKSKTIKMEWVPTADQVADIFTKATGTNVFIRLRARLMESKGKQIQQDSIDAGSDEE